MSNFPKFRCEVYNVLLQNGHSRVCIPRGSESLGLCGYWREKVIHFLLPSPWSLKTPHPFLPPVCTQCSTGPSSLPRCTETFKSQQRQSFRFLHVASKHFYFPHHHRPPSPCRAPQALCGHCPPSVFPCLVKFVYLVANESLEDRGSLIPHYILNKS